MAIAPAAVLGEPIEKKGTTPYVTHFIFRPLMTIDICRTWQSHHAGGGRNYPKHEGREDAGQDVRTLRSAERRVR